MMHAGTNFDYVLLGLIALLILVGASWPPPGSPGNRVSWGTP